nr:unnamed protein product [Callosobruchus chinensis]
MFKIFAPCLPYAANALFYDTLSVRPAYCNSFIIFIISAFRETSNGQVKDRGLLARLSEKYLDNVLSKYRCHVM